MVTMIAENTPSEVSTNAGGGQPPTHATGEFALRICGTRRDGQVVRLHSDKCTIGSGPNCTLRLRARGVGKLHCLVVRGPRAMAVRRFLPDTTLNGRAFTDAPLAAGDRLRVGPIELEVVAPAVETTTDATQPAEATVSATAEAFARLERQRQQLAAEQAQFDALRERFEQQRSDWATQRELVEAELESMRAELESVRQAAADTAGETGEVVETEDTADEGPATAEVSSDPPVDLAAVLDRLGTAPLLDEGAEDPLPLEEQAAERSVAADRAPAQPPQPAGPSADGEDEESMDECMARFMERVRGTGSPSPPAADAAPASGSTQAPQIKPAVADLAAAVLSGETTPKEPSRQPMQPRAKAPEQLASLAALREVANSSAHDALDRHARKRLFQQVQVQLAIALLAAATGAVLLWQWWSTQAGHAFYSAMIVFVVALLFGARHVAGMTGRRVVGPALRRLSGLFGESRRDADETREDEG